MKLSRMSVLENARQTSKVNLALVVVLVLESKDLF